MHVVASGAADHVIRRVWGSSHIHEGRQLRSVEEAGLINRDANRMANIATAEPSEFRAQGMTGQAELRGRIEKHSHFTTIRGDSVQPEQSGLTVVMGHMTAQAIYAIEEISAKRGDLGPPSMRVEQVARLCGSAGRLRIAGRSPDVGMARNTVSFLGCLNRGRIFPQVFRDNMAIYALSMRRSQAGLRGCQGQRRHQDKNNAKRHSGAVANQHSCVASG